MDRTGFSAKVDWGKLKLKIGEAAEKDLYLKKYASVEGWSPLCACPDTQEQY
ncbi:MAG: hypothetical protein JW882_17715 [Deltaproteobacteria bacterium]|nr:hypothetical protein [Deltaproteobacteria bacterium]